MGKKGIFEQLKLQYQETTGSDGLPVTKYIVVSDKGRMEVLRAAPTLHKAGFFWNKKKGTLSVLKDKFDNKMMNALNKVNQEIAAGNDEELGTANAIAEELKGILEEIKAAKPVLVDRDELYTNLENIIKGLENEESAERYVDMILDFSQKFRKYSVENILLIMAQKPEATFVASRKDWRKKFGRIVIDPKDAITINCGNKWYIDARGNKIEYKIEQQEADQEYRAKVRAGQLRPVPWREDRIRRAEESTIPMSFAECPVYDYSNTRGRDLPSGAQKNISLDFTGTNEETPNGFSDENAKILFEIAKRSLEQDGITVTQNPSTAGEMAWSRGNQINVSPDLANANPAEVILNEWAYDLLFKEGGEFYEMISQELEKGEHSPQQLIQLKEIMALTIAAAICRKYDVPVTVRPQRTKLLQAQGGLNNREITEKNMEVIIAVIKHIMKKIAQNKDAVMAEMQANTQPEDTEQQQQQ